MAATRVSALMDQMIEIAKDFTAYPGPRYRKDGQHSGEQFREEILSPYLRAALRDQSVVSVVLDGVAGYGSSFLEETFGGLVRHGFSVTELRKVLRIVARSPRFEHHKVNAENYIFEEGKRSNRL